MRAAAPIAAGHADYPSFRFVFPDPRRRAKVLPVFFEATVRDAIPIRRGAGSHPRRSGRRHRRLVAARRLSVDAAAQGRGPRLPFRGSWSRHPGRFPCSCAMAPTSRQPTATSGTGTWSCSRYGPNVNGADSGRLLSSRSSIAPTATPCPAGSRPPIPPTWRSTRRFGFDVIDPALPAIPGGPTLTTMRRPPSGAPHMTGPQGGP